MNIDIFLSWYTSVAGIVAVSILVINILKRALVNVPVINQIPTWFMVVIVAEILTFLCDRVFHTLPVQSPLDLFTQAFFYAAAASGLWEWLGELGTTIRQTAIKSGVNPTEE